MACDSFLHLHCTICNRFTSPYCVPESIFLAHTGFLSEPFSASLFCSESHSLSKSSIKAPIQVMPDSLCQWTPGDWLLQKL